MDASTVSLGAASMRELGGVGGLRTLADPFVPHSYVEHAEGES